MEHSAELVVQIVPKPDSPSEMTLNLNKILRAEARADEIAIVTPQRAPELLSVFNRGYLDATNLFAKVKLEQARAEDDVAKIKADILLERAVTIIKAKGLTSSADIRQAIVDSDPEYQTAKDRLACLDATVEYFKGKMKFLENAYTSVKKIMDTGNWQMQLQAASKETNGTSDETTEVGKVSRFGTPK